MATIPRPFCLFCYVHHRHQILFFSFLLLRFSIPRSPFFPVPRPARLLRVSAFRPTDLGIKKRGGPWHSAVPGSQSRIPPTRALILILIFVDYIISYLRNKIQNINIKNRQKGGETLIAVLMSPVFSLFWGILFDVVFFLGVFFLLFYFLMDIFSKLTPPNGTHTTTHNHLTDLFCPVFCPCRCHYRCLCRCQFLLRRRCHCGRPPIRNCARGCVLTVVVLQRRCFNPALCAGRYGLVAA